MLRGCTLVLVHRSWNLLFQAELYFLLPVCGRFPLLLVKRILYSLLDSAGLLGAGYSTYASNPAV